MGVVVAAPPLFTSLGYAWQKEVGLGPVGKLSLSAYKYLLAVCG